jgi:large repetitive protein
MILITRAVYTGLASICRSFASSLRQAPVLPILIFALGLILCSGAAAQTASSPSTNFGNVNVGSTSNPVTVTFTFNATASVGSIKVLTQGTANLDFGNAGGGSNSCYAYTYSANNTCTVSVTLAPQSPGIRLGAVLLEDSSNNVLATAYLSGTGFGPEAGLLPGSQSNVGSGMTSPQGVAADGIGNIFVANTGGGNVLKVPWTGSGYGATETIISGLSAPGGVAVDGSGNVYVADYHNNRVLMAPWNGSAYGAPVTVGNGFSTPNSVAVDGSGNVYIADEGHNQVVKVPWTGGAFGTQTTISSGYTGWSPTGVAVDGSGNVYIADWSGGHVHKLPWNGSTYGAAISLGSGLDYPFNVAVDDNGNVYIADTGNARVVEEPWTGSGYGAQLTVANAATNGLSAGAGGNGGTTGVSVDAHGNVYIADQSNNRIVKLSDATEGSLNFPNVVVGSSSAANITVQNLGNAPLSLSVPSGGSNPAINNTTANIFSYDVSSTCPLVDPDGPAGTLAAGASCTYVVDFAPVEAELYTGTLQLTDNSLTASATTYATQIVSLQGTGISLASITVTPSAPSILPGGTQQFTATGYYSDGSSLDFTKQVTWISGTTAIATFANSGTPGLATAGLTPGSTSITASLGSITSTPATLAIGSTTNVSVAVYDPSNNSATQSAVVGLAFPYSLTVQVVDALNLTVPGVNVTFAAPSSGASAVFSNDSNTMTATTNSSGLATVSAPTANAITGSYSVTATVGAMSASFSLTNIIPIPTTFTVTTLVDDALGSASNCTNQAAPGATLDAACSLRDAIAAATSVNSPGTTPTTIPTVNFAGTLATSTGTITPTANSPATYTLGTSGTLAITANMNIVGLGANLLTISGNNTYRVFSIPGSGVYLFLSGLTIANSQSASGGGINNAGILTTSNCAFSGNKSSSNGGAIYNNGALTVSNSTFSGNSSSSTLSSAQGGAIYNLGALAVNNSTFSGNSSSSSTAYSQGGAVYSNGTVTVSNSTFSGNSSISTGKASPQGGGIYSLDNALTVINSVFSGNSATYRGSASPNGLTFAGTTLILTNNLISDGLSNSGKVTTNTGTTSGNANLAPLGNYGGPTQTQIPLPGSAAICAGTTTLGNNAAGEPLTLPPTDQRGTGYPSNNTAYIGYADCLDAGAVQTNYALAFTTEPPSDVQPSQAFTGSTAPQVTLTESGAAATFASGTLNVSGSPETLSAGTVALASGVASFSGLSVSPPATNELLTATLVLNSSLSTAPSITATSSEFNFITPSPSSLSSGTVGVAYSQSITANNGIGPYSFAVTSGSLPAGLTLSSGGQLSGMPTVAGSSYNFTITATDANLLTGSNTYTQVINVGTATVTLGSLVQTYTGSALAATATTNPTGKTVTFTYTGIGGTNYATSSTPPTAVGSYTVVGTISDANYSGTNTDTLVISQATASVTPNAATKVYGTTDPALNGTLTGFLAGDGVTTTYSRAAGETVAGGPYAIISTLTPAGMLGNYNITYNTASFTISKAALGATAINASGPYGAAIPTLRGTLTGVVSSDGITASFMTAASSSSPAGSYAITPVLNDPNSKLANYNAVLTSGTLTIGQEATTASVQTSAPTVALQSSVTLTAKVASITTTPVGSVTFMDGSTQLGTATLDNTGTAMLSISTLSVGSHTLTAVYAGNADFTGSTSNAIPENVQDFTVTSGPGSSTTPPAETALPGGTATYAVQFVPTAGLTFPSAVTFTLSGLPAGATYTITPSAIPAGSGVTNVSVVVNVGKQQTTVALAPPPPPRGFPKAWAFAMFLPLLGKRKLRRALRAQMKTSALMLTMLGVLMVSGMTACGSGSGFLTQAPQSYPLTLTGTSGALHHSVTLILTVQ